MAKLSTDPLGTGPVGIVEGCCGYRARLVSIRGKFVFSRNIGYKMRGSSG